LGGRYSVKGEIASGGMGTVLLAQLQATAGFSRPVAIKRLHPQFAKDPEFEAMLIDEARLAARVVHPNVVSAIDLVVDRGEILLVMEHVLGETVARLASAARADGERTDPRIACAVAAGMLHGLHAAHTAADDGGRPLQLIHRDVSPQNVIVGVDGI